MNLKKLLLCISVAGMVASCTNEDLFTDIISDNQGDNVEVNFEFEPITPQTGTRTIANFASIPEIKSTWTNADKISYYDTSNYAKKTKAPGKVNDKATISGLSAGTYVATYGKGSYNKSTRILSHDITDYYDNYLSYYDIDNDVLDLSEFDMMYAEQTTIKKGQKATFTFKRKYSLLRVDLTQLPKVEDCYWSHINIKSDDIALTKSVELDVTSGNTTLYPAYNVKIDFDCSLEMNREYISLYIPIFNVRSTGVLVFELVAENGDIYHCRIPSIQLETGKYTYRQANVEKMKFVDLGLPSGTLWAESNVGAFLPYEDGHLFSWGSPNHRCFLNDVYLKNSAPATSEEDFIDPATENLSEAYVTPSKDDFQELLDNCDFIWVQNYQDSNADGYYVFPKKGEKSIWVHAGESTNQLYDYSKPHIFLPLVGYTGSQDGNSAVYWTSTYKADCTHPWHLAFYSTGHYFLNSWTGVTTNYGCSIRPIKNKDLEE